MRAAWLWALIKGLSGNVADVDSSNRLKVIAGQDDLIPDGATYFIGKGTSGANAELTVTVAAVAAKQHHVLGYLVTVITAAAGADVAITLKDGATAKLIDYIGNAAPRGTRAGVASGLPILQGTANTAINLIVAAAGAAAVTEAVVWGYTV